MAMLQLAAFAKVYETGDNEYNQFIYERVSLGQRHSHYEQSTLSAIWCATHLEESSRVCFLVHVNAALMAVVQRNGTR
ncbi:bicyclomycin resistance protein [Aspergillus luchuensis]|uniref:Bicyclomycin resistance protein n=1 Tax=Aspergillus kawachii TaxID=1069201 RepID=A0A146FJR4_ASPKA|nr:bicyclomycin resistance protein [Aspergillus luchuensis]